MENKIKDLVIQVLKNESNIQYKANNNNPNGCYQMGMIFLLGINKSVDFKKAHQYFSNSSLSDNQDVNCLLGFIEECEGNYSKAFQYYANKAGDEKDSYVDKVIKGRNHVQNYLKKLDLPIALNKEISTILSAYSKGKASKVGASIKIAAICNDKESCLEAARALYDSKDYISTIQWLQRGEIGDDNPLSVSIKEKFEKSKKDLLSSKDVQVIELDSDSLLSTEDPTKFLNKVKKTCEEASMKSSIEWKEKNKKRIGAIIRDQKNKEKKEILQEEAEEEARKKRRKKIIKYSAIAAVVLLLYIIGSLGGGTEQSNDKVADEDTILVNSMDESQANEVFNLNILSERKLSDSDLEGKSKKELEIMRNGIYARHGYQFKREDLSNYFSQFSWYTPITNDMSAVYSDMSEIEKYNVDYIKKHE